MNISRRSKAFLRYLVHYDYVKHKEEILNLRHAFMLTHSSSTPFSSPCHYYTQFDYTAGDLRLEVLPIDRLESLIGRHLAHVYISRLACSDGKMQLDVVLASQGYVTLDLVGGSREKRAVVYPWMFPMRSNSARLHDGLRDILAQGQDGKVSETELKERIRALAKDSTVLEIH